MANTTLPKEDPARRNKHTVISLPRRDKTLIGPELPKDKPWHPRTREWWDMWRRHEIAPMLEETDWSVLMNAAVLHSEFWFGTLPPTQMVSYHAEMRRVTSMFGATVEDRLKLRMKFVDEDKAGTPKGNGTPTNPSVNYEALMEDEDDS